MATFDELFAARNLTGLVQGIKPGLPLRIPAQYLTPTDRVPGHTFEWTEVDGNRAMAVVVSQDAPARRVGHQGAKRRSATMLRSFESQAFTANSLRNLMGIDGMVRDDMGRQHVTRQTQDFLNRLSNLKQTCVQRMLFTFKLYFNEKGEMLTSSSGATTSIDVGIPAGQLDQLDILGDGDIIDASWATATTNIPGHLEDIKDQMRQLGGWDITTCYYGRNIAKYIAANDYAKNLIINTPALATQVFSNANRVPTGFMQLDWQYAGDAFYIDAAGAVQKLLGDDEIVVTPSASDDSWWKHAVGSEMIPNGIMRRGQSASDMLGDLQEVFGDFAYAKMDDNPVSIEHFVGCNFLPLITATKAVCKADVTP